MNIEQFFEEYFDSREELSNFNKKKQQPQLQYTTWTPFGSDHTLHSLWQEVMQFFDIFIRNIVEFFLTILPKVINIYWVAVFHF